MYPDKIKDRMHHTIKNILYCRDKLQEFLLLISNHMLTFPNKYYPILNSFVAFWRTFHVNLITVVIIFYVEMILAIFAQIFEKFCAIIDQHFLITSLTWNYNMFVLCYSFHLIIEEILQSLVSFINEFTFC